MFDDEDDIWPEHYPARYPLGPLAALLRREADGTMRAPSSASEESIFPLHGMPLHDALFEAEGVPSFGSGFSMRYSGVLDNTVEISEDGNPSTRDPNSNRDQTHNIASKTVDDIWVDALEALPDIDETAASTVAWPTTNSSSARPKVKLKPLVKCVDRMQPRQEPSVESNDGEKTAKDGMQLPIC